jgi:hypothetical protein
VVSSHEVGSADSSSIGTSMPAADAFGIFLLKGCDILVYLVDA